MGDYLLTKTLQASRNKDGTTFVRLEVLDNKGKSVNGDRIEFEIPLEVHLVLGDIIDFYQGHVKEGSNMGATEYHITHDDYISAEIIRRNRKILKINAKDMRLLSMIREYQEAEREDRI